MGKNELAVDKYETDMEIDRDIIVITKGIRVEYIDFTFNYYE